MKLEQVKLDNIHLVSSDQAYEWVKTGKWSKRDFNDWVNANRREVFEHGQRTRVLS